MKDENPLRAGIFIFVGLIVFAIGILVLGKERHIFNRQTAFYTSFKDVSGLSEGAPVRIGGINAGRVSRIGFSKSLEETRVQVQILVDNKSLDRVRQDSTLSIETQGLLGDKYLALSSGDPTLPQLDPEAWISSRDSADIGNLMSKAQTIIENVTDVSESLASAAKGLDKNTLKDLSEGAKAFGTIAKDIKNGDGLVHRLFYSKEDADKILGNLTKATESLKDVVNEVKTGEGLLHSIIYEKTDKGLFTNLSGAAKSLAVTADLMGELATEIKSGDGLLHQVIYDDSVNLAKTLGDTVVKLEDAASAIKRASEALANGDGTIGALLVDSKLYDNLVEVTDGAKRSVILRQAIRSSLAKSRE